MHRRSFVHRWLALVSTAIILVVGSAAPALAGNTRLVTVGSAADGQLPVVTVSAGESIIFPLTVRNTGRQTLNNVVLAMGQDGLPTVVENDPQSSVVPAAPVGLPTGVSITDSGTGGTNPGSGALRCTGGATLRCEIGTMGARSSFAITVTIGSNRTALAAVIPTKAVVTVAEIGNDQGSNADTFAAEGSLNLLAFSCDSISAYRKSQSPLVSTCAVTDADAGGQSASITLPAGRDSITLNDAVDQPCPTALGTCYGPAGVLADVTGDQPGDTILWVIDVKLAPRTNVNVFRVVVYHEDDDENVTLIALTRKNACRSITQVDCGAAQVVDVEGTSVLRVTFQTAGNGKARV